MSGRGFIMRTARKGLGNSLDETIEAFKRRFEMGRIGVHLGLPDDAVQESTGTPLYKIGQAHEFGTIEVGGHIPERSWLRGGVRWGRESIVRMQKINLKALANGKIEPRAALERLGVLAVSLVRQYIKTKPFTPLAESTLAARERKLGKKGGSLNSDNTTPLIDEGDLYREIGYEVIERE